MAGISSIESLERRAGIEPANTGFADLGVDRFATGATWDISFSTSGHSGPLDPTMREFRQSGSKHV